MEEIVDSGHDSSSFFSGNDINAQYQKRLFEKIRDYRLGRLAGYVQNDFQRMLDNGTITKDDIAGMIAEMEANFDRVVKEINNMKSQCKTIMTYYAE